MKASFAFQTAMRPFRLAFAAALLLFLVPAEAAGPTFPPLTGRVVDDADILSSDTRAELNSMLSQQEQQTGDQIVVVTLKSLQGYPIEEYGYQLGRHWGIGQKGKDNGVLLIIVPSEREARIEVGYGLEGQLTDAQSKLIIAEILAPAFKLHEYDRGVLDATSAILKTIGGATITQGQGEGQPDQDGGAVGLHIPVLLVIFILWIVFGRFFWPLFFLGGLGGGRNGWSGGGFGGGGFSGGGGSFGGGGASGSW